MALLRQGDAVHVLGSEQEFGRSERCRLRLASPHTSTLHASIRWRNGWELCDLGSANGTFINGIRLDVRKWAPLREGDRLTFAGDADAFLLEDANAPCPMLLPLDGTTPVRADCLDRPLVRESDGGWAIAQENTRIALIDACEVRINGVFYRVSTSHLHRTATTAPLLPQHKLTDFAFTFSVSRDEEHVEVQLRAGDTHHCLPSRSFHYVLLLLARARLEDENLPETSRGWMHLETLAEMLKTTPGKVNVDVFRARSQLAVLGVVDPELIVERRAGTGQLRIGVSRLRIEQL